MAQKITNKQLYLGLQNYKYVGNIFKKLDQNILEGKIIEFDWLRELTS